MDIIHHINFNSSSKASLLNTLIELNVKYKTVTLPGNGGSVITFDIAESDPKWPVMFGLLKTHLGFDIYHGGDSYDTVFSEDEIRNAEWARLIVTFYHGYPYPKNNWPFKQLSLTNVCRSCAVYEQNAPIQFYAEPNMKKNAFLALNMFKECFATQEVFTKLDAMEAKGYEARSVICHKTEKPSEKVQQLYIPKVAKAGVIGREQMRQVLCQVCGTIKYYPHQRGKMGIIRDALPLDTDFVKTNEWFGIGFLAWREILVSNRIANLILDEKWQGVQLKVVEII